MSVRRWHVVMSFADTEWKFEGWVEAATSIDAVIFAYAIADKHFGPIGELLIHEVHVGPPKQ